MGIQSLTTMRIFWNLDGSMIMLNLNDVTNVTIAHEDEQIKAHKKYILLRCGDPSLDHTENVWNLNGIWKYMDMKYLFGSDFQDC